ncbi:MAG: DUF898 family protein [Betaproteobacteria bacterium]|nr:MAG: DUF898 family protein [Betaproteobacteria bacterium]
MQQMRTPLAMTSPTATLNADERLVQPEFTATATEYFRIWIVNLFFTLATLGIYISTVARDWTAMASTTLPARGPSSTAGSSPCPSSRFTPLPESSTRSPAMRSGPRLCLRFRGWSFARSASIRAIRPTAACASIFRERRNRQPASISACSRSSS